MALTGMLELNHEGTGYIVVSPTNERPLTDRQRKKLLAAAEDKLAALLERVAAKRPGVPCVPQRQPCCG